MQDYNPPNSQNQLQPPLTSSKPTKRQQSDDDDIFVPVSSELKSDSRDPKHQQSQEGDGPTPQVPPHRSGRLKKQSPSDDVLYIS